MISQERINKILDIFHNRANVPDYHIYNLRKQIEEHFISSLQINDIYDSFIKKALPIFLKNQLVEDLELYIRSNCKNYNYSDSNQIIINNIKFEYAQFLVNKYVHEVKGIMKELVNERMILISREIDDDLIDQSSIADIYTQILNNLWGVSLKDFVKYHLLFNLLKFKPYSVTNSR
ncbi:hypothetical protein EHS13_23070 [Paenibacillus psychroresistens]|uniref:Uncharacterized protein n=1 Tax=Paenibacillus psychroresistens TaxID=1778678 RepID=A0A6B8RP31_9BACL|nr:hypothetical protein [Paenibacillus psychroresistens]QGQ97564.1 hypothetical protein EHS13_23070 [Paenibacillus psychroresistens]